MSYVLNLQGLESAPVADGANTFTSTFSVALCGSSLSLILCFAAETD